MQANPLIDRDAGEASRDLIALALRIGLGVVFAIGGWNKLRQLVDPERQAAIVSSYTSAHGYVNAFFADYLFTGNFGDWLTPWSFLTALSAFELVSGFALMAGFLTRPLALVWGVLLWTFVMALPVVTAPENVVSVDTFTSPAMLVQVRDVGLSGMMFVLFNLGSGRLGADALLFGAAAYAPDSEWDSLGLLLRHSMAAPLNVGGAFAGFEKIVTFGTWP